MEPADVDLLYCWENASEDWWMGATLSPISREAMTQFVAGNHDIYRDRQLRWMLDASADATWTTVGAVDMYDFEPRHGRAGVAVHIDQRHRRLGHALRGLQLLARYADQHLGLQQLFAEVPASNRASLALFGQAQFQETGRRTAWIRSANGDWEDVVTLQRFFNPIGA